MHMRSQIMGGESKANDQAFVAENTLLVAEDGIRELWVKSGGCGWLAFAGLNQGDLDGVIGVA